MVIKEIQSQDAVEEMFHIPAAENFASVQGQEDRSYLYIYR